MKTKRLTLVIMGILVAFSLASQVMAGGLKRFGGRTLHVTTWSGPYAEGFREAFVIPFMEATGAKVILHPGWGEFISKIKASPPDNPPYDVFLADGWNYINARNNGFLLPIRKENIPNLKYVYPFLKEYKYYKEGLGVPFDGGPYLLVYMPDKVPFTPRSWSDLKREEVIGKITLDETWYYGLYIAAFINRSKPGIEELFSDEGIDECFEIMAELAPRARKFYKGGAEFFSLLKTGEAVMGPYYSAGTFAEMQKGLKCKMVVPEEGIISYVDFLTVIRGTKNRDLAEAFINFCLDAKNQTIFAHKLANWMANSKAELPEEVRGLLPTSNEEFEKMYFEDWEFISAKSLELSERWKKEVLTRAR